jgi:hypothetical protein
VPTIYVDRVNIGGSESGQQSAYYAKGASNTDNTWNIDGVPITDMGATGSTPTYYSFDMFQEMAVTTGGADAQNPTPGVQLNMVLKKGANIPHGDASVYFENQSLQSNNLSPALAAAIGGTSGKGNRTDNYLDGNFDLGGPLIKDRLWAWGSIGRTDVRNLTLNSALDETILKNYAFKADGQVSNSVRANFTFVEGNKVKNGRSVGLLRPPETGWNQTGPTKVYTGGGDFVLGQNLFLSAKYAYITGGFQLAPAGGLAKDYYFDDGGVAHNTFYQFATVRPQRYAGADASYFAGKNEVKFGFSWRKTPVTSSSVFPGSHIVTFWNGYPNMLARPTRDFYSNSEGKYVNGYVTDTISLDRLTVTGGIRFDHQTSSLTATVDPGVPGFDLLPTLTAPQVDNVYDWNTVTPRVGFTYAVSQSRKTILRASYAMFASQLAGNRAAFVSPIQYSYVYYNAVDKNGDGIAQLSEILFNQGIQGYSGFDPKNPTSLSSVNKVDPNIKAPKTNEFLIGMDHEVVANLAVGGTFTYRRFTDLTWAPRIGVNSSNYHQAGVITGTFPEVGSVNVPYFAINPGAIPPGGGRISTNRPDYHQTYWGLELSATKRMSNHWMARLGFSTNDWKEYFDNTVTSIEDPTPAPASTAAQPTAGPFVNGGPVINQSAGSGKSGIYLLAPRYQITANGLYEGPWGINLGANLISRQGYGQPFFDRISTGDALIAKKQVLLASDVAAFRLPNETDLDFRAEKMVKFGRTSVAFDFDIFNILNAGTVLGKQYDASRKGVTGYDQVLEIMNPRIARVGMRFLF